MQTTLTSWSPPLQSSQCALGHIVHRNRNPTAEDDFPQATHPVWWGHDHMFAGLTIWEKKRVVKRREEKRIEEKRREEMRREDEIR